MTVLVGLLARDAQGRLGLAAFGLYDDDFMAMSYLRSAQNTLLRLSRDVAEGTASPDDRRDGFASMAEDLEVVRARARSPAGRQAADRLAADLATLPERLGRDSGPGRSQLQAIEQTFDNAVEVFAGDGYRDRREAAELIEQVKRRTWFAMAAAVAIALAITMLLSRAIVPQVRHAVRIATDIAAGRLDNRIDSGGAGGRSETRVLLRALATMQTSIADKIARIEGLLAAEASSHANETAAQHARFKAALDNMSQGLCLFDAAGALTVLNRRFREMFGSPPLGSAPAAALPASLLGGDAAAQGETGAFTRTLDDGRVVAVSRGPVEGGGWVATYEDVTDRSRIEARFAHMARHDALTGLPNRVLLREHMTQVLPHARRRGGLAVLCLDLDRFKDVNEAHGTVAGDALLRAAAERIVREVRDVDMVVRLGGDEFAIIQAGAAQPSDAGALAERLVAALAEPFQIDGSRIASGVSIGVALADGQAAAEELLKNADIALYRAKMDGRGRHCFFEQDMQARLQARRLMEADLREAIRLQQFELHYQPLVSTVTGAVNGFEALIRWRRPVEGLVPPALFIPLAEELGLIAPIGSWVLDRACRDAAGWPLGLKVAVNLSSIQFRNRRLADEIATALDRSGLPAAQLNVEITESVLLQDDEVILDMLREIHALGVRISMDDFGTGYSSLSYLRRFTFDKIKIDQSFIRQLDERPDCLAIVRAVIALGRSLDIDVMAEGVETEEQLELLRAEGCLEAQGYLFSKPRPACDVAAMIDRPVELA